MTDAREDQGLTYAAAGVDTDAGDRAVELMKAAVKKTHGTSVVDGVGGFAGLIDVSELKNYERPLLASSTDGVGTKIAIAQALDIHDTIGQDLVAMVVDDIVVSGAKPLAMTDYIACGKVHPERIADIVRGIAEGCVLAETALVGGETAEHPGLMGEHDYDVAGAAVGVVEASRMLGAERVGAGDVLIGMDSSGLHSNGYSLVRAVVDHAGLSLEQHIEEFGKTLGEELLTPTHIYSAQILRVLAQAGVGCQPCPRDPHRVRCARKACLVGAGRGVPHDWRVGECAARGSRSDAQHGARDGRGGECRECG